MSLSELPQTVEPATRPVRLAIVGKVARNPWAALGCVLLLLIAGACVLAPLIAPYDPVAIDLSATQAGPSGAHLLGTDLQGRDILSRLLYGGRVSLLIGVGAVAVSLAIGVPLGAVAGYFGGWLDAVIMRLTDIVLSFPVIILTIVAASVLGTGIAELVLLLGLISWTTIARLVRGAVLSLREMDFVIAAQSVGARDVRVLVRHVLPSTFGLIAVYATFGIAQMILIEASLSFLGLGVQPPTASWGNMLTDAQSLAVLQSMPWMWMPPAALILVTIVSINFVGDGIQRASDPRLRGE